MSNRIPQVERHRIASIFFLNAGDVFNDLVDCLRPTNLVPPIATATERRSDAIGIGVNIL